MGKLIESIANNNGFWVLIGILVGTIIEVSVHRYIVFKQRKKDKENFKFELELNIKKVDRWLGYVDKMRKDLSTDSIHNFNEYFDFSKTIFIIANNLSISGELYSALKDEYIEKLQQNISFLTVNYENLVNDLIRQQKQEAVSSKTYVPNPLIGTQLTKPYDTVKAEIVTHINYLEQQLSLCKNNFEDILANIK